MGKASRFLHHFLHAVLLAITVLRYGSLGILPKQFDDHVTSDTTLDDTLIILDHTFVSHGDSRQAALLLAASLILGD